MRRPEGRRMSDQTLATASDRPTAPPPPGSPSSPSGLSSSPPPPTSPSGPPTSPVGLPVVPPLPSLPPLPPLPPLRSLRPSELDDSGPTTAPTRAVDLPVSGSAGPVSSGTIRAHRAGRRTARVSHQPRGPQARTPGRLGRGLTIGAALGLWVTSFLGGAVIGALTRAVDPARRPSGRRQRASATDHRPPRGDGAGRRRQRDESPGHEPGHHGRAGRRRRSGRPRRSSPRQQQRPLPGPRPRQRQQ
jgi:hypothetical protein